ncbi:histone-lysine N-methyltransferase SETMAR [Trichonephila clavipes]|nr:histone-lysine N-methyltransferase SETMAR [Trichonephila clavipes]
MCEEPALAAPTKLFADEKVLQSFMNVRVLRWIESPDLTPSDFHLFLHLKSFLAGKHLNNNKELKENVSNWLKTQAATFYEEGIEKLVPR